MPIEIKKGSSNNMERPIGYVYINNKELKVKSIEITTSRDLITDHAVITFPNFSYDSQKKLLQFIKIGMPVEIKAGFYPKNINRQFKGYINKVSPDKSVTIECQDEAYKYKKMTLGKEKMFKDTNTEELINAMALPGQKMVIYKSDLGNFKVGSEETLMDVLGRIKDTYGLYSYFRGDTLYVGGALDNQDKEVSNIILDFQGNVPIDDKTKLNHENDESVFNMIKGEMSDLKGKKYIDYAYYDSKGNIKHSETPPKEGSRSNNSINIGKYQSADLDKLKRITESRLKSITQKGINGTIYTFGFPHATHGGIATVKDKIRKDIKGNYYITSIKRVLNPDEGFMQYIELGKKLSE